MTSVRAIVAALLGCAALAAGAQDRPSGAPRRYAEALELVRQNRLEEARGALLEAARLDPARPEICNLLGSVYDRLGQLDEAVRQFRRAIELDPTSAASFNNLAIAYLRKNEPDRAIEQFERALQLDPGNTSSHYNLGVVLAGSGRTAEAVSHLEHARRNAPGDLGVLFNLGTAYLEQGRAADCVGLFERLPADSGADSVAEIQVLLGTALGKLDRLDDAEKRFAAAIRLRPDAPDPHYRQSLIYQKSRSWPQARAALERAIALHRSPPPEYYVALGETCRNLGQIEDAKSAFKKAMEGGGSEAAHIGLGLILLDARLYRPAAAEFDRALARNPSSVDAGLNAALALHRAGDQAAARARLEALGARDAARGASYFEILAGVRTARHEWTAALEALRKASELRPDDVDLYFRMGLILVNAGVPLRAVELFQKVAVRHPSSATILTGLGQAQLAADRLDDAALALSDAARRAPGYDEPHFLLGNVYQEKGDSDRAAAAYRRAIAITPERAAFHAGLAGALLSKQDPDGALAELRRAAELEPSTETAARIASILIDGKKLDEAERVLLDALKLDSNHRQSHYLLMRLYRARGDSAKAAREKDIFERRETAEREPPSAALEPVDYYLAHLKD